MGEKTLNSAQQIELLAFSSSIIIKRIRKKDKQEEKRRHDKLSPRDRYVQLLAIVSRHHETQTI